MINIDKYILWLSVFDGITPIKKYELYKFFKSAEKIYNADEITIAKSKILTLQSIEKLMLSKKEIDVDKIIELCNRYNIDFISIEDKNYPQKLAKIPDPPLGIFVVGSLPEDNFKSVAIIGSRRCSEYGATQAYKFSKEFAKHNIVIISGMAMGIDSKAHMGAIDGGGKTIAVLGCGADIIYPSSNKQLRDNIIKNGCIISEYPPQTEPLKHHFPQRNRIISGLSDAVCVAEAAKRSGTLITVNQAIEQGREVFAVPGNITSYFSQGCNNLLKTGCSALTEPADIYSALNISLKADSEKNAKISTITLATEEKMVYDCIGLQPITIEEIMIKTNSQIQTIQYILTMLEIKGYVTRLSGQKYIRSL